MKESKILSRYKLLLLLDKKTGKIVDTVVSKSNSRKALKYIKEYEVIRIPASGLLKLIMEEF